MKQQSLWGVASYCFLGYESYYMAPMDRESMTRDNYKIFKKHLTKSSLFTIGQQALDALRPSTFHFFALGLIASA